MLVTILLGLCCILGFLTWQLIATLQQKVVRRLPQPQPNPVPTGFSIEIEGDQTSTFQLLRGEHIIGRRFKVLGREYELDSYVSRKHARIVVTSGAATIVDAGSSNGLFVNGRRVSRQRRLEDEDRIKMGDSTLIFHDALHPKSETFPPRPWGNLEVKHRVGTGGMSQIYTGTCVPDPRDASDKAQDLAFKMPKNGAEFEECCKIIEREGDITKPLRHDHVLKVFDRRKTQLGWPFLVMEYLDGGTLRDLLLDQENYRISTRLVQKYGTEIANALDYIHREGLIHCDVKPENLLFDKDRKTLKLADFGCAVRANDPAPDSWSYHYASPEHAEGKRLSFASDLYMLGCVLHEMLVGAVPFEGAELDVLNKKTAQDGTSVSELKTKRKDIPEDLNVLVCWLLKKEASERPRSAAEVVKCLGGVAV